jgi:mycothiol system anti-sigma-R factor
MATGESWVECNETIEILYHYLDGELTEERRVVIKRHLDDCPPCLHAFDFEVELRQVIADRCKDRVPESLRQRIHDALIEAEREREGHTAGG